MTDPVDPKLRQAESEIDSFYLSNGLTKKSFANAAWWLFSFSEDTVLVPFIKSLIRQKPMGIQFDAALAARYMSSVKYPIRWLFSACNSNDKLRIKFDDTDYDYSQELFELGKKYLSFEAAFTYASLGIIELRMEGDTIIPEGPVYKEWEYEAYNRLTKIKIEPNYDEFYFPTEKLINSLSVKRNRISYKTNPKIISETIDSLKPFIEPRYSLPDNWEFSKFSLYEFRCVYESLFAMSFLHRTARILGSQMGCDALGFMDAIKVIEFPDLVRMIVRYSDIDESIVINILDYLTYGNCEIKYPDPALQPLIRINDEALIPPSLWISSNAERNLTVLLNRIPSEKDIYLKLVSTKEDHMRESILDSIKESHFRHWYGNFSNEGTKSNIDMVLIDDRNKLYYLIELKWFIEPAEVRECVEKAEELAKGVNQLLQLEPHFDKSDSSLFGRLKIDNTYTRKLLVVSANWIGFSNIQNDRVPIINETHLIEKLKKINNLKDLSDWLESRSYLPQKEREFDIDFEETTIGKYSLRWYFIRPLIEDIFLPI